MNAYRLKTLDRRSTYIQQTVPTLNATTENNVVRRTPLGYLSKSTSKCLTFYLGKNKSTFPKIYRTYHNH